MRFHCDGFATKFDAIYIYSLMCFLIYLFFLEFRKQIGHFTVMINDKNNAVGCASSKYYSKGNYYRYLVCNYGFTNVFTQSVYEQGATASKCVKRHSVYQGLCSPDQVVIPVPWIDLHLVTM